LPAGGLSRWTQIGRKTTLSFANFGIEGHWQFIDLVWLGFGRPRDDPWQALMRTSEPPHQVDTEASSLKPRKSGTAWRHANIGRLLNNAVRRFEARVLELMSERGHAETRIAHVSLTRNLDVEGTRLTELARRASMSKQAMGELVDQFVELGLVDRIADPSDGRARIVKFTRAGLIWLNAFRDAVDIAEREMHAELGKTTMDAILKGLAAYGATFDTLDEA
jgi:DNA-binding MarR family transcriptional regulator